MQRARLRRSTTDKMLTGVAGGMAEYFEIDPVFVRIGWVIFGLAGMGIILYIALALITPGGTPPQEQVAPTDPPEGDAPKEESPPPGSPEDQVGRRRALFAAILIGAGAIALMDNLGFLPWELWEDFWPVALIIVGVFLLLPSAKRR